jgi:pimeloyl-ACP methyl ester carboxylesterase
MNPSGYAPSDLAQELFALMDFLGIESAHLAGHSFGGAVALGSASLFPRRVRSLTLADAIIGSLQRMPWRGDGDLWKDWGARIEQGGGVLPKGALRVSYGLMEEFAREESPAPVMGKRAEARWRNLLATTSALDDFVKVDGLAEAEIGGLTAPVLAIYGEYSFFTPTLERLSEILPDCRRVLLEGAGHFHPLTRSLEFSRHLRSFVECNN